MIDTLLQSIAMALKEEYSTSIYVDQLPQGMKDGDIFLLPVNAKREQISGNLWRNTYDIDVHLFKQSRFDAVKQAENIKRLLEWITYLGDGIVIRGKDVNSTYFDGVAHIFITYILDERKAKDGAKMATLEIKGGVKDEQSESSEV